MKKSHSINSQILALLKKTLHTSISDLYREPGMRTASFYTWQAK